MSRRSLMWSDVICQEGGDAAWLSCVDYLLAATEYDRFLQVRESVDVKGSGVDVKDNSLDVKGNSVDVKGKSVDVEGNSENVEGNSVDVIP
eukprot:8756060-Pyramimonas_sp.AAC.1